MSKPITDVMHHIGGGFFISTASDKMSELVRKVGETGKVGKIDLTITVKKQTKSGAMHINRPINPNATFTGHLSEVPIHIAENEPIINNDGDIDQLHDLILLLMNSQETA